MSIGISLNRDLSHEYPACTDTFEWSLLGSVMIDFNANLVKFKILKIKIFVYTICFQNSNIYISKI